MRFLRYLDKNLFTAPYRLLPLAVFTFFAFCFLFHPFSALRTGQLADPDDYMRLDQVINWLQGQGWYDLSQPRLSPGAHTVIHWSRLVDLPIALVMLPFIPTLDYQGAAMVASFVVPPALFGLLLMLVCALAKLFIGPDRANLAAVFALFAPMVLFNFTPGRVDHHAYQILIAGYGLLSLHLMTREKDWLTAVFAACAFAGGLWIGTEALPWVILFAFCLAMRAGLQGGVVARNAAVFGIAFPIATAITLLAALPPEEWGSRALSWFSLADVIFAALTGLVFILGASLGKLTKKKYLRLGVMLGLAVAAGLVFLRLVPDALIGPFADYDNFNSMTALDNISEARPLSAAFAINRYNPLTWTHALQAFVRFLFLPMLALSFLLYKTFKAPKRERALYAMHADYLLAALLLTFFWQVRVGHFMQLFAIAPLTAMAWAGWKKIGRITKSHTRYWAEIAVFAILAPLPVLLLPAIFNDTPLYPDVLLFPAARADTNCSLKDAAEYLATMPPYATHPTTIMTTMNEGPELLFRTPHNVIGGNYNVAGNTDVFAFFNAHDDAKPLAIARQWQVGLVLVCRNITPFMAGLDHPKMGATAFLKVGEDGQLHLISNPTHLTMIERLANGHAPAWLKPVEIPGDRDYLLYSMDWNKKTGKQSP